MSRGSKYSPEFKEQAVKRAISGTFTIKEVSESLGISYFVLRQWKSEFLKKSEQINPPTNKQIKESEELKKLRKEFKVTSMAKYLDVSRSGFYDYVKRLKYPIIKIDSILIDFVKETWQCSKTNYGLMRILNEVRSHSLGYGARKVKKAMNLMNIKGKQDKKFRISTTDSKHSKRIALDLVQRKFKVETRDEVWVSDVTFIKCFTGWLYLCVILDLYSRKVVSWKISLKNDSELIVDALNLAIISRNPSKGLIFHIDRGSNYCSNDVRKLLANNKIRRSNSRKGNCWDNAVAESFFATLKREIEFNVFQNLKDAKNNLFDYIEVFYNRQRSHSFLGYVSPEKFELKMN